MAIERGYDFYFWGHSDVALLAASGNSSFGADALECVEAAYASAPDWGILYFAYDWFSAIRTDLVRQVRGPARCLLLPGVGHERVGCM